MASAHHAVRLEREGAPSDLEGRSIRGGGRASVEDGKVQGRGFGHDDRFLSGGGADRWIKLIGRGGQRRALASPSAYRSRYEGLRWLGLLERVAPAHATPRGCRPGSVLVGAHDRQDARGDGGISGNWRAEFGRAVEIIDFPEVPDAALVDRAEVVFAVWIVVVGEGVEGANLREQRASLLHRHGFDAGGDEDHAADKGAAEGVVEGANAFGGGHGCAGHGFAS